MFEQSAQGDIATETLPHASDDPCPQQGMAAQVEKIIPDSDSLAFEGFGPDRGDDFFFSGARRDVTFDVAALVAGGRQCPAIQLAGGGERKPIQPLQTGGDHVVGKALFQSSDQFRV